MDRVKKFMFLMGHLGIIVMVLFLNGCESEKLIDQTPDAPDQVIGFPEFITPTGKYFDTRIDGIPPIGAESYRLKVSGAIDNPASFTLEELGKLEMVKKTITIECIGNPANGGLIGTATWRGFKVYDLLASLGIDEKAATVKYICADGYYTYNTIEELQSAGVLGALYMNDHPIPPLFGFPLRIIFPGYYGVRHPGWIVEIEVLETGPEDFWIQSGWNTDSAMTIDSKIFFPSNYSKFSLGDSIKVGGAAFGSRRISSVELTIDNGNNWIPVSISQTLDQDYVWIFWEAYIKPQDAGIFTIRSRARDMDGRIQAESDNVYLDGTNSWPKVEISVF